MRLRHHPVPILQLPTTYIRSLPCSLATLLYTELQSSRLDLPALYLLFVSTEVLTNKTSSTIKTLRSELVKYFDITKKK